MRAQSGTLILFLIGLFMNLSNDMQYVGFVIVAGPQCGSFGVSHRMPFARVALAYSFVSLELFECLYDA